MQKYANMVEHSGNKRSTRQLQLHAPATHNTNSSATLYGAPRDRKPSMPNEPTSTESLDKTLFAHPQVRLARMVDYAMYVSSSPR